MERKKRSKGRGWESCYVKIFYGTFGVEMRAYGYRYRGVIWSEMQNCKAHRNAVLFVYREVIIVY